jgi:hypothetical protein
MNHLTDISLLSRRIGDVNAIVSRMDRRLGHPPHVGPSPCDTLARLLCCHVLGARRSMPAAAIAAEVYRNDAALLGLGERGAHAASAAAFAGVQPGATQTIFRETEAITDA